MPYVLNLLYAALLLFLSPLLIYSAIRHGKYRDGLAEKLFGLAPRLNPHSQRIWFHAVSVGEVNLLTKIIESTSQWPDTDIVISTTTKTGYALAKKKYANHVVFYCPLDFSWAMRNAFARVQPNMFVLVELELWPNLLMEAARRNIPLAIINGRLSDRSTRGYLRLGSVMRKWMSGVNLVTAQSQTCANRFVQLGVDPNHVHGVGSLKFDGARSDRDNSQTHQLRRLIDVQSDDLIFVAGSTQSPEEEIAVDVYSQLAARIPTLRLILVPRHPERFDDVAQMLASRRIDFIRRSEIRDAPIRKGVTLVDTIGELGGWWGTADVGFVGGSMGSRGGQNMIEPAAYGVATCFGPNTKNFRGIVEQLLDQDAARVVATADELNDFVSEYAQDAEKRFEMGERAKTLVDSQRGSTAKTVALLRELWIRRDAFLQQPRCSPQDIDVDSLRQNYRRRSA